MPYHLFWNKTKSDLFQKTKQKKKKAGLLPASVPFKALDKMSYQDKTYKMACVPSKDRSAWASTQSDKSICYWHEESTTKTDQTG